MVLLVDGGILMMRCSLLVVELLSKILARSPLLGVCGQASK